VSPCFKTKAYGPACLTQTFAIAMNRRVAIFHLREAAEELNRTVAEVERNESYDLEEFRVAMGHLYHHLNTAWNGRDQTDDEFAKCTDESFRRFRKFPSESELFLE